MTRTIYLLIRIAIGTSMFAHGLVRLPKLAAFSAWMVNSFQKSMLPIALVKPFSIALPILEFTIGILLLIGLFTKQTLIIACLLMTALIFGHDRKLGCYFSATNSYHFFYCAACFYQSKPIID